MRQVSDETKTINVWKEMDSTVEVGGVKLPCFISAEIVCILEIWSPQNMDGQMEDAVEGDKQVTLDSVLNEVVIYASKEETNSFITIQSTDKSFFEEHFGELEVDDVLDYA